MHAALAGSVQARSSFAARMQCVPRFLHVRNQRLGSVLGPEDLRDLTQDVLALVWKKLADFRGAARLETWVYRIAVYELMNRVRKLTSQRALGQDDAESHLAGLRAPRGQAACDYDDLHVGLERLGPPEGDVLRLKHFDELTFDEIGAELAIPANTAKTIYYRGIARLRELLGPERTGEA